MRRHPEVFAFVSAPVDTLIYSPTIFAPPLVRSLRHNKIGDKGASALAAVLKETRITHLECAAAPQSVRFVSAPIDTRQHRPRSHARSLRVNNIGPEGGAALAEGLKGNTTLRSLE